MYKFSFIVIMKDTHNYLERCLDSIVNQSFKNFETIVIDDHSIIRSDDIITRYQKRLENISYHYLDSSVGPGGARNYGIKFSKGEYLMFFDSDDWVDIDILEKASRVIDQYNPDIAMCNLMRNYDTPTEKPYYKCNYQTSQAIDGITAFRMMSGQYNFGFVVSPSALNKFFKKEYLQKNNIFFAEKVYYEDVPFAFQTFLSNGKVVTIPNTNYHNYKRSGSIIQSLTQRHFDDMKTVFMKVREFLKEKDIYDEYMFNYYKIFERFYNLLIRQVFNYAKTEDEKKEWMLKSIDILKEIVVLDEFTRFFTAEEIRRHLQPYVTDLTLY